jgi:hypothetical protein
MRSLFAFLLLAHGLIHFMGFAKAFKIAEISQLTQPISRPAGALWLITTLLFMAATVLFFLQKDSWWMVAVPAMMLSQGLIFSSWQDAKFGSVANVIVLIGIVIAYGTWSYYKTYKKEVINGLTKTAAQPSDLLTETDIAGLPEPVRKYLFYTGAVGKPKVEHFKVEFVGQIRKNEQSEWMPFTSEQYNFMEPATRLFFMKATMKHLPVAGFHSFKNGDAFMDIRLFSLFKVQYQTGKEMGVAETVTFFNDMCCMAPATLIDKRIQWLEIDRNKVKASFTNQGITISAWLFFDEQGALTNFISEDRFAVSDDGAAKQIPWATPLKDYKLLNEHQVPGYAEAIYTYPEGNLTYGTFRTTNIEYNSKDFKPN